MNPIVVQGPNPETLQDLMELLVWRVLCLLVVVVAVFAWPGPVIYTTQLVTGVPFTADSPLSNATWIRSQISDEDDGPLEYHSLQFAFPYFATSMSGLSIGPNADIDFNDYPLGGVCCESLSHCYFSTSACNLDSYMNMVLPLVADWYPMGSGDL